MISIIVSSYKKDFFEKLSENIKSSIGSMAYEIIKIDNPGKMGICQAYNQGAACAKYPYLVFCHEDIFVHTKNWGKIIIDIFEVDDQIGLIGCAGGMYKTPLEYGWSVNSEYTSAFMIGTHYGASHLTKTVHGKGQTCELSENLNIPNEFRESVIVNEQVLMLDGMYLVTKKSIHDKIKFDQDTFKGFHCYDLDYSFQVGKVHKVIVNHNILIEHLSPGNFGVDWLDEIQLLNKKWSSVLPYSLNRLSDSQKRELEFTCFEHMLRIYRNNKLSVLKVFKSLFRIHYINKVGFVNWLFVLVNVSKKTIYHAFKSLPTLLIL